MKKLYTTILLIAVTLFISCDEKKAEDDIKKAIEKMGDKAVDKVKPKPKGSGTPPAPTLTKPALSDERAPWNEPILFPKTAKHTYTLKEEKTGVAITEYSSETMQVTATQSAQNVIIVATFDGSTTESNPIEFTRIPGNTLSYARTTRTVNPDTTGGISPFVTRSETVAGDTRNIQYSVSPTGQGVTIDSSSGDVSIDLDATERNYIITAELAEDEKYEQSTATYTLTISKE